MKLRSHIESNEESYKLFQYEFYRNLECYRELLDKVVSYIPKATNVLDLGCGPGLLAERILGHITRYKGIEMRSDFVKSALELSREAKHVTFVQGDINIASFGREKWNVITILNVLYQVGIHPMKVLRKAYDALKPGGMLIVSGPTHENSFRAIKPQMEAQLKRDGLKHYLPQLKEVAEGNAKLLQPQGHYWTMESMDTLLKEIGFRETLEMVDIYYQHGFLVSAKK